MASGVDARATSVHARSEPQPKSGLAAEGGRSRSAWSSPRQPRNTRYWLKTAGWTSPLGLEGLLTNPGTPGGKDGGEANPTELHEGVQGTGGEAAAGRRQGAVGGGDGAWHWHRAAQPVAHRAPGGRLGRGT